MYTETTLSSPMTATTSLTTTIEEETTREPVVETETTVEAQTVQTTTPLKSLRWTWRVSAEKVAAMNKKFELCCYQVGSFYLFAICL